MPSGAFCITLLAAVLPNGSLSSRSEEWTDKQRLDAETCQMPILQFKYKNGEGKREKLSIAPRHEEAYLMSGRLNVEYEHEVHPALLPLPEGFVRLVDITWIYEAKKH